MQGADEFCLYRVSQTPGFTTEEQKRKAKLFQVGQGKDSFTANRIAEVKLVKSQTFNFIQRVFRLYLDII